MESEKRLIDANELESRLICDAERRKGMMNCFGALVIEEIIACELANSPTIDAVEVVRCKDCKHYNKDSLWCGMNSQDRSEWFNWYDDDFCSYGERRTDV